LNYIGFAGLLSTTKDGKGHPVIPGVQVADLFGGGLMAALGVVSAYVRRQKTGQGAFLDISMTDGVAFSQPIAFVEPMFTKSQEGTTLSLLTGGAVCYNAYKTQDGRFVTLGAIEEKFWKGFIEAIGRPEWALHQFDTADENDPNSIYADLCGVFRQKTMAAWEELLARVDTCFGIVQTHAEAMAHPLFLTRGLFCAMNDPDLGAIPQLSCPIKVNGAPFQPGLRAPGFGEHTQEILEGAGVDLATIEALKHLVAIR
jgi:crotonobetainyl-CoA:carnitine CoA-transferase CaiB-like acyl-CoA transferase